MRYGRCFCVASCAPSPLLSIVRLAWDVSALCGRGKYICGVGFLPVSEVVLTPGAFLHARHVGSRTGIMALSIC